MTLASSTLRRPLATSCFVTKPAELDSFLAAVEGIGTFWLGLVRRAPGP
ncbi:hypothetical protein [Sorangium sp. So ce1153]